MKQELDFPSKIENLSYVEKLIDDVSTRFKLSSEVYGNILVAIVEAVSNAILHGNKLDSTKTVQVKFSIDNDFLIFWIKDEGPGFDIKKIPDPTLPENVEKPHGRGIFLMTHLADEVSFSDNGTEVELKFRIK